MSVSRPRLGDARLREIAAGDPVEPHEAETLLESPEARARLAERDPSALFGALAALDVEAPALPAIPPRSALASRSGSASRPVWRMALGLAAASIAMACLLALTDAPDPLLPGPERTPPPAASVRAALSWPPLVERVQSPTARIVALVPPGAEGPTVTLILDEEIDP